MQSSQPTASPAPVAANGTSDVTIHGPVPTDKTGMVVHVTFNNHDSIAHTAILKRKPSGGSAAERKRVTGIPAGAAEEEWCSVNRPIHLADGDELVAALGEGHSTTAPTWSVDAFEGTD